MEWRSEVATRLQHSGLSGSWKITALLPLAFPDYFYLLITVITTILHNLAGEFGRIICGGEK